MEAQEMKRLTAIRGVRVVRPETGEVTALVDLRLRGAKIDGVAPAGRSAGVDDLDGGGLYALPGLIDAHVHALGPLVEDTPGPLDLPWLFRQWRRNLSAYLRSGVTTIRDMCAPLKLIREVSRRAGRLQLASPRILYAGPMVTVPGGYPHYLRPMPAVLKAVMGPLRVDLRGPSEVPRVVRRLRAAGVQCIKVPIQSLQYDDARTPLPTMSPGLLRAIVEEGRRQGLGVAVHAVYRADLRAILGVPFASLEHTPIDAPLEEADIAALAARATPVTSTLCAYGILDQVGELGRIVEEEPERFEPKPRRFVRLLHEALGRGESPTPMFGRTMLETGATWMRQNVRRLGEAGLPVVFGTDSGIGHGLPGCPHWEMAQLTRAGFTPREALAAATCNAARALGRDDLGCIEAGATADVVLLRGNPLEDLSAIRRVAAVVREGRLMHLDPAWVAAPVRQAA